MSTCVFPAVETLRRRCYGAYCIVDFAQQRLPLAAAAARWRAVPGQRAEHALPPELPLMHLATPELSGQLAAGPAALRRLAHSLQGDPGKICPAALKQAGRTAPGKSASRDCGLRLALSILQQPMEFVQLSQTLKRCTHRCGSCEIHHDIKPKFSDAVENSGCWCIDNVICSAARGAFLRSCDGRYLLKPLRHISVSRGPPDVVF